MTIDGVLLKNFRGFEDAEIRLPSRLAVLVGENGSGKSTVLQALEIGAWNLAAHQLDVRFRADIEPGDTRIGAASCEVTILEGGARLTARQGSAEFEVVGSLPDEPPIPIVLGVTRSMLKTPIVMGPGAHIHGRATVTSKHAAFDDGRERMGFTSFERFEDWFRPREDIENQERVRRKQLEYTDPGLAAVREAFAKILPGFSDPRIDRERDAPFASQRTQFVLTKGGLELGADQLSDGERSLMVMAATIARRLALGRLNGAPAPRGLVLIDEIELHLHPRWQRKILGRLTAAFPSCQFVVTTHSPQVLASVPHDSVVVLEQFKAYASRIRTEGRESGAILSELMGVGRHPDDVQLVFDEIARLIDDEKLEDARSRVDGLASKLGDDDQDVVRLRSLLSFLGAA